MLGAAIACFLFLNEGWGCHCLLFVWKGRLGLASACCLVLKEEGWGLPVLAFLFGKEGWGWPVLAFCFRRRRMGLPLLAFCLERKAGVGHCLLLVFNRRRLGAAIACLLFWKGKAGGFHCLLLKQKKAGCGRCLFFENQGWLLPLLAFKKHTGGCHCF